MQQLSMTANVFAGLSIVLALFILGSALYLRSRPDLRHTIDRVSFRLMLWSMIAEILFGINYLGQIAIVSLKQGFLTYASPMITQDGAVWSRRI